MESTAPQQNVAAETTPNPAPPAETPASNATASAPAPQAPASAAGPTEEATGSNTTSPTTRAEKVRPPSLFNKVPPVGPLNLKTDNIVHPTTATTANDSTAPAAEKETHVAKPPTAGSSNSNNTSTNSASNVAETAVAKKAVLSAQSASSAKPASVEAARPTPTPPAVPTGSFPSHSSSSVVASAPTVPAISSPTTTVQVVATAKHGSSQQQQQQASSSSRPASADPAAVGPAGKKEPHVTEQPAPSSAAKAAAPADSSAESGKAAPHATEKKSAPPAAAPAKAAAPHKSGGDASEKSSGKSGKTTPQGDAASAAKKPAAAHGQHTPGEHGAGAPPAAIVGVKQTPPQPPVNPHLFHHQHQHQHHHHMMQHNALYQHMPDQQMSAMLAAGGMPFMQQQVGAVPFNHLHGMSFPLAGGMGQQFGGMPPPGLFGYPMPGQHQQFLLQPGMMPSGFGGQPMGAMSPGLGGAPALHHMHLHAMQAQSTAGFQPFAPMMGTGFPGMPSAVPGKAPVSPPQQPESKLPLGLNKSSAGLGSSMPSLGSTSLTAKPTTATPPHKDQSKLPPPTFQEHSTTTLQINAQPMPLNQPAGVQQQHQFSSTGPHLIGNNGQPLGGISFLQGQSAPVGVQVSGNAPIVFPGGAVPPANVAPLGVKTGTPAAAASSLMNTSTSAPLISLATPMASESKPRVGGAPTLNTSGTSHPPRPQLSGSTTGAVHSLPPGTSSTNLPPYLQHPGAVPMQWQPGTAPLPPPPGTPPPANQRALYTSAPQFANPVVPAVIEGKLVGPTPKVTVGNASLAALTSKAPPKYSCVLLSGIPAVGKTTVGREVVNNLKEDGLGWAFFSGADHLKDSAARRTAWETTKEVFDALSTRLDELLAHQKDTPIKGLVIDKNLKGLEDVYYLAAMLKVKGIPFVGIVGLETKDDGVLLDRMSGGDELREKLKFHRVIHARVVAIARSTGMYQDVDAAKAKSHVINSVRTVVLGCCAQPPSRVIRSEYYNDSLTNTMVDSYAEYFTVMNTLFELVRSPGKGYQFPASTDYVPFSTKEMKDRNRVSALKARYMVRSRPEGSRFLLLCMGGKLYLIPGHMRAVLHMLDKSLQGPKLDTVGYFVLEGDLVRVAGEHVKEKFMMYDALFWSNADAKDTNLLLRMTWTERQAFLNGHFPQSATTSFPPGTNCIVVHQNSVSVKQALELLEVENSESDGLVFQPTVVIHPSDHVLLWHSPEHVTFDFRLGAVVSTSEHDAVDHADGANPSANGDAAKSGDIAAAESSVSGFGRSTHHSHHHEIPTRCFVLEVYDKSSKQYVQYDDATVEICNLEAVSGCLCTCTQRQEDGKRKWTFQKLRYDLARPMYQHDVVDLLSSCLISKAQLAAWLKHENIATPVVPKPTVVVGPTVTVGGPLSSTTVAVAGKTVNAASPPTYIGNSSTVPHTSEGLLTLGGTGSGGAQFYTLPGVANAGTLRTAFGSALATGAPPTQVATTATAGATTVAVAAASATKPFQIMRDGDLAAAQNARAPLRIDPQQSSISQLSSKPVVGLVHARDTNMLDLQSVVPQAKINVAKPEHVDSSIAILASVVPNTHVVRSGKVTSARSNSDRLTTASSKTTPAPATTSASPVPDSCAQCHKQKNPEDLRLDKRDRKHYCYACWAKLGYEFCQVCGEFKEGHHERSRRRRGNDFLCKDCWETTHSNDKTKRATKTTDNEPVAATASAAAPAAAEGAVPTATAAPTVTINAATPTPAAADATKDRKRVPGRTKSAPDPGLAAAAAEAKEKRERGRERAKKEAAAKTAQGSKADEAGSASTDTAAPSVEDKDKPKSTEQQQQQQPEQQQQQQSRKRGSEAKATKKVTTDASATSGDAPASASAGSETAPQAATPTSRRRKSAAAAAASKDESSSSTKPATSEASTAAPSSSSSSPAAASVSAEEKNDHGSEKAKKQQESSENKPASKAPSSAAKTHTDSAPATTAAAAPASGAVPPAKEATAPVTTQKKDSSDAAPAAATKASDSKEVPAAAPTAPASESKPPATVESKPKEAAAAAASSGSADQASSNSPTPQQQKTSGGRCAQQ